MSGLTPNAAASGGATPGASITELAQQHGVSRESLVEFVQAKIQQARQDNGQAPLDQSTLEEMIGHTLDQDGQTAGNADDPTGARSPGVGGYTSSAQRATGGARAAGRISILA